MNRLNFQERLVYATVTVVVVIFVVAMSLVYVGARDRSLSRMLADEQSDLNRNVELLSVMLREGKSLDEVKRIAMAPWKDGSGNYIIVEGHRSVRLEPNQTLLTATVGHGNQQFTVGEIIDTEALLQSIQRTFRYFIVFAIMVLALMLLALYFAIRHSVRPEVQRQRRLDAEFDIARRIQQGMLPSLATDKADGRLLSEVQVGALVSASKEIGGDFYNYLTVDHHFHFIIADVSGKGIPAALYMAIATKLYAAIAADDKEPAEIASKLNETLSADNPASMFITALIGRLDLRTGEVQMCNAGHNPPLTASPADKIAYVETDNNIPLGLFEGYTYSQQLLNMAPGSHLMLYTDGVTEAEDRTGEQLGSLRLISAVASVLDEADAEAVVTQTKEYIDRYARGREQADDITIFDIRYNGPRK